MADNRMYLTCKGCGESFLIAKSHGGLYPAEKWSIDEKGDTTWEGGESYLNRLNAFFEEHEFCRERNDHEDFIPSQDANYYLSYESVVDSSDIEWEAPDKSIENYNKRAFGNKNKTK